ncbi:hypothetical protein MP228_000210 [Amoeboaphelidium protococcarum]|nr:hypothetical protein MP228_000210 [Amoeboaphelidium protococcarum]
MKRSKSGENWEEQIQRAKLNNNFISISSSEDSESASDEELSSVPPDAFSVAARSGSSFVPASSLPDARPLASGASRPPLRLEKAHPSLSSPSFQRRYGVTPTRPPVKVRSTVPGVVSSSSLGGRPVSGSFVFAPSSPPVDAIADSAVGSSVSSQRSATGTKDQRELDPEETGLLRRGLLKYGPSKWAVILKDPEFEGLVRAGKKPCQLKYRCRTVLQRLIKIGASRDQLKPWILGTPLGSGSDYRFDQKDLEEVLRFRDQAIGGFQGTHRGGSGSQWDNAMMDAVMGEPSSADKRNPSPVVGRQYQQSQRSWLKSKGFQYAKPSHFGKSSLSNLKSSGECTQRRYRNAEVVGSQLSGDHSARRDSQGRQYTSPSASKYQWSARSTQQGSSQHRNMEIPKFSSRGGREETEESSADDAEFLDTDSEIDNLFANLSPPPTSAQHSSPRQTPANSAAVDASEEMSRRVKQQDQLKCPRCTKNEDLLQKSRLKEQRLLGKNQVLRNELQSTRELLERIYEFRK